MDRYVHKTMMSVASIQEFVILAVKNLCRVKLGKNFEENYYLRT